ncbi:DUF4153 domain-containing protein [Alistipes senegalensis]|uniref:DUF4153 domain-containing protein n=1 Tax=Alistipes senegalensis JC50 TaxID=1033732 RepID=A0ABY5V7I5_9BACT|nr:DUF4153 domain-containing protein [Alistipes senegalensis]UEA86814.1 DUF4153 domain-containing protein [Alistipes senegalensis]UWN65597.1 DUF4153 domain-containing protein [Alistipes senegalensis JC50]
MKAKLEYCLQWLRDGAVRVVRSYPVETLLALYACIRCLLTYELDWSEERLFNGLALVPLFFALALAVNNLAGRGPWRKVYWAVWTPIVPLTLWSGLGAWVESAPFRISLGILAPLLLLLSLRAVRNDRFVNGALVWLRSGLLALLFANVALGLFYAILYSTTYIFGLEGKWIEHVAVWAVTIVETLAVPVLFLMMADRWRGAEMIGNRILEILLNYIVTPALLIYTAILYLYMAKILFTWSLPEGGVAYMVFGFTMTALAVKALDRLLVKRIYDWFFDHFSLVSLPMLVLFWIGVVRRTNEYGLTEPRVYLLVCGGLMTFCVLLFLSQRAGRYLWVCLAAWVSFAVLAYVPCFEPGRIAVQSQLQRAERLAERLGRLGEDGRLLLTPVLLADTVHKKEYRQLYESLDYIRRDSAAFARFGVKRNLDDLAAIFPEAMRDYVRWGYDWSRVDTAVVECVDTNIIELEAPVNVRFEVNAEYPHYYTNLRNWYSDDSYNIRNDTLCLYLGKEGAVYRIPCRDLLERQLERSGFDPAEACEPTPEQLLRLLDYRDDRCRILFENIKLERTDSAVVIQGVSINAVLMR